MYENDLRHYTAWDGVKENGMPSTCATLSTSLAGPTGKASQYVWSQYTCYITVSAAPFTITAAAATDAAVMSPLATLLFTLAALLAAVKAQRNCNSAQIGISTPITIPSNGVPFPPGGGIVNIDDWCQQRQKGVAVGNWVTACNADQNGTGPNITPMYSDRISPVLVRCPDGCPQGGAVAVVQYCA
ncbi:uncharacterized protein LOC133533785 [Cydia pomonella]|uniref:uncharacterized protein LOC133533785 n=1 Tax=Cydia pomonella TaxID=82600 RepID=UPI002ADD72FF|nr:uncharacterized protein LOC133533785 [Cydia pomonella]